MKKRKRHQVRSGESNVFDVAFAIVVCDLVTMAGLGYVYQKKEIVRLGATKLQLESARSELRARLKHLQESEAALTSTRRLEEKSRDLGLVKPSVTRRMGVPQPSEEKPPGKQLIASR